MNGSHPSLFELSGFVRRGATSAELEAHVSACDPCAERLSGLARRVASPIALPEPDEAPTRLQAAVAALVACLAVLVVRAAPMTTGSLPEPRAPEGTHGIGVDGPLLISSSDAGPVDSGVR